MAFSVDIIQSSLSVAKAQLHVVVLPKNFTAAQLRPAEELHAKIALLCAQRNFTGQAGSTIVVPQLNDSVQYLALVGLGDAERGHRSVELWRRAIGTVIRTAQQLRVTTIAIELPQQLLGDIPAAQLLEQAVIAAKMAAYEFDTYKTEKDAQQGHSIVLQWCVPQITQELQTAVERGEIIAQAVNDARQLINLPANIATPAYIADVAREVARKHALRYTVFGKEEIRAMGMGGITAVGQGSAQEPKFVILEHKAAIDNVPTLALVGKGITFDSGGLSLKPAKSMETMKDDMSGAAAVLQAIVALAQLRSPINVVALMPLAENMPSGSATRPGDIITFFNGKTAEVLNTDAEGRLILADALAYAVQTYKPTAIVDVATLTGACAAALGPFYTGLLAEHERLAEQVVRAAEQSGDAVWRLPFTDDYKVAMRSAVADLCNIGKANYMAGATTAAVFLQHFVGDTAWAHLDIAGTAFDVPDISYYRPATATGASVRLLIELAMRFSAYRAQ
ncbi:leucyl aminopeptidase [Candidatus Dependentiae bacterium]|nr:leucyl aminopeptidase [Candidatus Dependentiae bacterium]